MAHGCFVAMNEQNATVVLVSACVRGLVQQSRWHPREGVLERGFVEYQKSIMSRIVCTDGGNMAGPRLTKHSPVIVDQDEITLSLKGKWRSGTTVSQTLVDATTGEPVATIDN
jgi:hypothetical protein